jgi:glucose-1-phosphate thymidylyltransferase
MGIPIEYAIQENPRGGIGEAFLIGRDYIGSDTVMLILGDNVFIGLNNDMLSLPSPFEGAHVLALEVPNPHEFGVINFDSAGHVASLEEKPKNPTSRWIVPGLYFYNSDVVSVAESCERSDRKELEITSINQAYLQTGRLTATRLSDAVTWFDCGNPDALLDASNFIALWERAHGRKLGCPAEACFRRGLIDQSKLSRLVKTMANERHKRYLSSLPTRT